MNVNIICVGKIKEDYFIKATAEFEKRLSRFCNFNVTVLPDRAIPDNASKAEEEIVLKKEYVNEFNGKKESRSIKIGAYQTIILSERK